MLPLGKNQFVPSSHDFTMSAVFDGQTLPQAPSRFGHGSMFKDWLMLGNGPDNTVRPGFGGAGNCVFAGGCHETMETARLGGHLIHFTGANAIADYSAVTGYVVGDPSTDNGTYVRDALSYRRKVGLVDAKGARHKIGAYVLINTKDWDQLMQAIYIFGAVGIGFEFPQSAWDQYDHGMPWDVVPGSPIEGGHYVPVMGRSSVGVGGAVTWARRQPITRAFSETYTDEAWGIVYPEELRAGKNERGFDLTTLNSMLAQLK